MVRGAAAGLGAAFRRVLDIGVAAVENHPEAYAVIHRALAASSCPDFRTDCTIAFSSDAGTSDTGIPPTNGFRPGTGDMRPHRRSAS